MRSYRWLNLPTYLVTWLFPGGRSFWKVYVYFRWLDDIVDDPAVDAAVKSRLVVAERHFLERTYADPGAEPRELTYEHRAMRSAICEVRDDAEVKARMLALMDAFAFDVARFGGKRVSRDDLMSYSRTIGCAYTSVLSRLMKLSSIGEEFRLEFSLKYGRTIETALAEYAHYCHLVHVLRDREIDQRCGYDNLPLEYEGFEQFAQETLDLVRRRFKDVEYEHFFLLAKYRVSFLLSLAAFCYYSRFVVQLQGAEQRLRGSHTPPRWSLANAVLRFLRNRFYYLEGVSVDRVGDAVRHRAL